MKNSISNQYLYEGKKQVPKIIRITAWWRTGEGGTSRNSYNRMAYRK